MIVLDEVQSMINKILAPRRPLSDPEHPGPDMDLRATALFQRHILGVLAERAVAPDDLAAATFGRVTCPVEHRDMLRALIARSTALEPGMMLPWRLTGDVARCLRCAQRRPALDLALANETWHWGPMLVLTFLTSAAVHASWRWRIVQTAEVEALASARAIDLIRAVFASRALGLAFAPPTAQEQDAGRLVARLDMDLQSLLESHLHARALLDRVMHS